jgi:hypothetical protein
MITEKFSRGSYRRLIPNKVIHNPDGTTNVFLERKSGPPFVCVIDTPIYSLIKGFRWSAYRAAASKTYYAKTAVRKENGAQTTLYMQQFIFPEAEEIDHKDGDGLNNRRENLRPATHSQNMSNRKKFKNKAFKSSKFLGVHWREEVKKFRAYITLNRKRLNIGHFEDEIEAAKKYDEKAKEIFGDFARLNFPDVKAGERAA